MPKYHHWTITNTKQNYNSWHCNTEYWYVMFDCTLTWFILLSFKNRHTKCWFQILRTTQVCNTQSQLFILVLYSTYKFKQQAGSIIFYVLPRHFTQHYLHWYTNFHVSHENIFTCPLKPRVHNLRHVLINQCPHAAYLAVQAGTLNTHIRWDPPSYVILPHGVGSV